MSFRRKVRTSGATQAQMVRCLLLIAAAVFLSMTANLAAGADNKTRQAPSLPNALILGDSISIGYTPMVIEHLKGRVKVARAKANCGDSNRYLRSLPKWLGDTKWDVIHFNMGLHDLCYRHPDSKVQGNRDKVNGTIAVPLEAYEKNLEKIVIQLKATGARLIWASTTVVPEQEAGRFVGDEVKYNTVARKIMERHGIQINDLHALSAKFPSKLFKKPGDVHFHKEGSLKLARQVVSSIQAALKISPVKKPKKTQDAERTKKAASFDKAEPAAERSTRITQTAWNSVTASSLC